jgi:aryl-alcohol dehydrogenase-like predicted oxidoreductase
VDKPTVFSILDYYRSAGGNFIDTANSYQDNQSEERIGEWMADRGVPRQSGRRNQIHRKLPHL